MVLPMSSIAVVQARRFTPLMFIAHEPQMPSRHDRRNATDESTALLIWMSPSSTIGPQPLTSISKVSMRGFSPEFGSKRYTLNVRISPAPLRALWTLPFGLTLEFLGRMNWAIRFLSVPGVRASSVRARLGWDALHLVGERVEVNGAVV